MPYTPGPWTTDGKDIPHVCEPDGRDLATVWSGSVGDGEAQANARLMAASPDLLRLLKEAVLHSEVIGCTGAWRLEALNAIARAEGRVTQC